jgi:uncharacterized LabA/DUF88 family protein
MKNGKERCAIFIDVQNMAYLDPRALLTTIGREFRIEEKVAFADYSQNSVRSIATRLSLAGIDMLHVQSQQNGGNHTKSYVDQAMVSRIWRVFHRHGDEITTFVIVSGDSDFKHTILVLKDLGKKTVVVANPNSVSNQLLEIADRFIPVNSNDVTKP